MVFDGMSYHFLGTRGIGVTSRLPKDWLDAFGLVPAHGRIRKTTILRSSTTGGFYYKLSVYGRAH